jgi:2-dehydropantoate 2-reductase
MKVCVIGAGALGGTFGARLALAGNEVTLVDSWADHIAAIAREGLHLDGVAGDHRVRVAARTSADGIAGQDLVLVATDANATAQAAGAAAGVIGPDGVALTVQNGIGNVERMVEAIGQERVLGGSTMASFRTNAPGWITQTHAGPTTIGELDGRDSERLRRVADAIASTGMEVRTVPDIIAVIWEKFLLNLAINPICAVTFLRLGEFARLAATDRFQDHLLEEAFAVIRAKGLKLDLEGLRRKIKAHSRAKYSKPSMLQHMERGRRTEIDALNGALVREAEALGLSAPYNDALVSLVKGCEAYHHRRVHGPELDEEALEAAAAREAQASS